MLIDDFFIIKECTTGPDFIHALIDFNKSHSIFTGHFPGNPVVPGVCMIQMVKEILEKQKHVALKLLASDNIKFLSVINPMESGEVNASLSYKISGEVFEVKATLSGLSATYLKFNGLFAVIR